MFNISFSDLISKITGQRKSSNSQYHSRANMDIAGGKVTVNGKSYYGNNIQVIHNDVYIDGEKIKSNTKEVQLVSISITVEGNCENINMNSGNIRVNGSVNKISNVTGETTVVGDTKYAKSTSGAISINGNCENAETVSGAITATKINSANSLSGKIKLFN